MELISHSIELIRMDGRNDFTGSQTIQKRVFEIIKSSPQELAKVTDWITLGSGLSIMLNLNMFDHDEDALRLISDCTYLSFSKAINQPNSSDDYYSGRWLGLIVGSNQMAETLYDALEVNIFARFATEDVNEALRQMEFHDYYHNPAIVKSNQYFLNRYEQLDNALRGLFDQEYSPEEISEKGSKVHKKVLDYLENRLLNDLNTTY